MTLNLFGFIKFQLAVVMKQPQSSQPATNPMFNSVGVPYIPPFTNLPFRSLRFFAKLVIPMRDYCGMDARDFSTLDLKSLSKRLPTSSTTDEENLSRVECTPDIEKKFVHNVYDAIAPHFSSTRFAKWPKVAEFLESLSYGSIVLDVGCGNGKYLGFNKNCHFIGCDISAPLVTICANKGHEVLVADAVKLPYRTGFGDAAISIAILHHLSTQERRKKAIEELTRIVRKGGKILITVWAFEQEDRSLLSKWTPITQKYMEEWVGPSYRFGPSTSHSSLESIPEAGFHSENNEGTEENDSEFLQEDKHLSPAQKHADGIQARDDKEKQEFFVPWHLPYHQADASGSSISHVASGFAKKDDKKSSLVYNRYYHVFAEGELERLASSIDSAVIIDSFYDKSNWCLIMEKT